MSAYPTPAQVEAADTLQLARWMRHLPSPALHALDRDDFQDVLDAEVAIAARIRERFDASGGWNPGLSKAVGW